MVNLLFIADDQLLTRRGVVKTMLDPACGTGGMLSVAEEHLRSLNSQARLEMYGQELNPESYAICGSDMTVAAFANSRQGGTLLIGVADDGTVYGLATDYASLRKPDKDDRDLFLLHLNQAFVTAFGETVASTVSTQIHSVDGADLCRVHVPRSTFPVDATVTVADRRASWRRGPPSSTATAVRCVVRG